MADSSPAVFVENLHKTYVLGASGVAAVRGITFNIARGEFVAIMGPSGCGKTTLLNLIGLLDVPTRGRVLINGVDVMMLSEDQRADLRRDSIGYVFQFYNLLPMMSAIENVMIPMQFKGVSKGKARERAMELLQMVGLADRAQHQPPELSGGEQQRVTIARALANEPALILLDEPTGDLDSRTEEEVMNLIQGLNKEKGHTFVMVTHDAHVASRASRVLHILDGLVLREDRVRADGTFEPIAAPAIIPGADNYAYPQLQAVAVEPVAGGDGDEAETPSSKKKKKGQ